MSRPWSGKVSEGRCGQPERAYAARARVGMLQLFEQTESLGPLMRPFGETTRSLH
jgi:hypothetical protein